MTSRGRAAWAALALLAIVGCGGVPDGSQLGSSSLAIEGGSVDQTDSNVVGILINSPSGLALCSGSLIAPNLVLTAHHCVADAASTACSSSSFGATFSASAFVVTPSYDAMAPIFNNGGALPAPDGVTWFGVNAVSVAGNDICGQDLAALTLSSPITGVCPLIPRVDVDVTDGEPYTAVGFGVLSPNGSTAGVRYSVGGMGVICGSDCGDPTMSVTLEWEGGATTPQGTCEGDSGGPSLDSQGRVMGSVSRGPANACNSTVYESYYGEAAWLKNVANAAATAGSYSPAGWVTGSATSDPTNGYCLPSAPSGLSASAGNAQISLTWSAPASAGTSTLVGYNLYEGSTAGGESASPVNASPVSGTSYTATGLTNGTPYFFVVKAVNADGESRASGEASATPAPTVPGAPTGLTATRGDGQASLSWTAPASDGGDAITRYSATCTDGSSDFTASTPDGSTTTVTVTGLVNGTVYACSVVATNAMGNGAASASASVTPATVPGAPVRLTASGGDAQASLSWSAPASDGGDAITGYTASCSDGTRTITASTPDGLTTAVQVTGLTNGTGYACTVVATNTVGVGPASASAAVTPAAPPGAPTGLVATAGEGQVTLSWTAPTLDGGASVVGYNVYKGTRAGGESATPLNFAPLAGTRHSFTGLNDGVTYSFVVKAVNSAGISVASNEASATPEAALTTAPATAQGCSCSSGPVSPSASVAPLVLLLLWTTRPRRRRQA